MSNEFDPYAEWLGIPASQQPADHYRLLGIARYESDGKVIAAAADQRMVYLRGFQMGEHAKASQKILNTVSTAKVCLLNADSKAQYDSQLQSQLQRLASTNPASASIPPRPAPPDAPSPNSAGSTISPAAPGVVVDAAPPAVDPMAPAVEKQTTVYRAADAELPEPLPRGTGLPLIPFLVSSGMIIGVLCAIIIFVRYRKSQPIEAEPDGPPPIALPEENGESLAGQTVIVPEGVVAQRDDGYVVLDCNMATVNGASSEADVITWDADVDSVAWEFLVNKPGFFKIEVTYAAAASAAHGSVEMKAADRTIRFRIRDTGGWENYTTDPGKTFVVKRGGRYKLVISAKDMPDSTRLMNLKQVRLKHIPSGKRPTK
jgi:hypothetical protein